MCVSVHDVSGLILFKYGVHCGALDHIHLSVGLLNKLSLLLNVLPLVVAIACSFVRCTYSCVASHSELSIGGTKAGVWRFQPFLHVNDLAETPFQPTQILQFSC